MPTVTIWTLESKNDAKAVGCLANKLVTHLQLGDLSIRAIGGNSLPKRDRNGNPLRNALTRATQIYLKQDACVIFVIDRDGPIAAHNQQQQPNSLVNQIKRVVNNRHFDGKVFFAQAVQELEAWLLIDCLGIFCYFARQSPQHRTIDRDRVSANQSFAQLVRNYQTGNTENIVEAEIGGKGAKEYLRAFSERILQELNPRMRQKNVNENRYKESLAPKVAEHLEINQETLRRNNSFRYLGQVLAQFK